MIKKSLEMSEFNNLFQVKQVKIKKNEKTSKIGKKHKKCKLAHVLFRHDSWLSNGSLLSFIHKEFFEGMDCIKLQWVIIFFLKSCPKLKWYDLYLGHDFQVFYAILFCAVYEILFILGWSYSNPTFKCINILM